MPETKFLVAVVIVIVSLAVLLFWILTNYETVTKNFFDFLSGTPLLATGG
jgi:hypothetical protein